jgi:hypothetical protein
LEANSNSAPHDTFRSIGADQKASAQLDGTTCLIPHIAADAGTVVLERLETVCPEYFYGRQRVDQFDKCFLDRALRNPYSILGGRVFAFRSDKWSLEAMQDMSIEPGSKNHIGFHIGVYGVVCAESIRDTPPPQMFH